MADTEVRKTGATFTLNATEAVRERAPIPLMAGGRLLPSKIRASYKLTDMGWKVNEVTVSGPLDRNDSSRHRTWLLRTLDGAPLWVREFTWGNLPDAHFRPTGRPERYSSGQG